MEIFIAILSAGIGAGIMNIVLEIVKHKWSKTDKRDEKIDAIVNAQKVIMIDRVRYLGREYLKGEKISLEDKENLKEMYEAYKALGGNGHLDTIMNEIENLTVSESA